MSVESQARPGPIVVAVDNTASSAAALRWAVAEAERTGTTVRAIHVTETSEAERRLEPDPTASRALARERMSRRVADWLGNADPETRVSIQVASGPLGATLARAAGEARLVVLGSSTCTAHASLADELTRLCPCPVALVDESGRRTTPRGAQAPQTHPSVGRRPSAPDSARS